MCVLLLKMGKTTVFQGIQSAAGQVLTEETDQICTYITEKTSTSGPEARTVSYSSLQSVVAAFSCQFCLVQTQVTGERTCVQDAAV